jgi:AcrR family transcriptional regulator
MRREYRSRVSRPRKSDIDARLLEATRRLLDEVGYERITMDAVAAEAGVGKPALYRRFPSRAHLVFAATVEASVLPDMPDTGGLRSDLVFALQMLVASLEATPRQVAAEQFEASIKDPEFARAVAERVNAPALESVHAIWRRAVERGEIDPALDGRARLMDLSSAIVMRVLYFHMQVTAEDIDAIVDHFLHGALGPRGGQADT